MNSDYEKLESVIGYEFDNKKLLVNALTHTMKDLSFLVMLF